MEKNEFIELYKDFRVYDLTNGYSYIGKPLIEKSQGLEGHIQLSEYFIFKSSDLYDDPRADYPPHYDLIRNMLDTDNTCKNNLLLPVNLAIQHQIDWGKAITEFAQYDTEGYLDGIEDDDEDEEEENWEDNEENPLGHQPPRIKIIGNDDWLSRLFQKRLY